MSVGTVHVDQEVAAIECDYELCASYVTKFDPTPFGPVTQTQGWLHLLGDLGVMKHFCELAHLRAWLVEEQT
jgi:hypothetical protein